MFRNWCKLLSLRESCCFIPGHEKVFSSLSLLLQELLSRSTASNNILEWNVFLIAGCHLILKTHYLWDFVSTFKYRRMKLSFLIDGKPHFVNAISQKNSLIDLFFLLLRAIEIIIQVFEWLFSVLNLIGFHEIRFSI